MEARVSGKQENWEEEIRNLEQESRRAFVARDMESLDRLFSDDMIVNSPIHRVHRKPQVLDLLRAGVIAHATYEGEIEAVEKCGDLAVVMGSEKLTNTPDGPLLSRRFTNVWRPEGDSWRLVVRQATVIG
jgi:ketosteroid isomerase-like protein